MKTIPVPETQQKRRVWRHRPAAIRTFRGRGDHSPVRNIVALAVAMAIVPTCEAKSAARQLAELSHVKTFPVPFSYFGGLRRLSDGNILVADPLGRVLVAVDMERESADTLGRIGSGPEEYLQPDAVIGLPGDSTLLIDLGNNRMVVVAPDFSFGATRPLVTDINGDVTLAIPRFADERGNLYFEMESFARGSIDSAAVLRLNRITHEVDTMGFVSYNPARTSGRTGRRLLAGRGPLSPRDDWAVTSDGRVAFVRAVPYAVEWRSVNGSVIEGSRQEYRLVGIGTAEKEEWIAVSRSEEINLRTARSPDGRRTTSLVRGSSGPRGDLNSIDWPRYLPPFRAGRSIVSPEGELWVERYVAAGDEPVIDVIGLRGELLGQVFLPSGTRVVGFGPGTVYLVRRDEVDLHWLEEYRIQR